MHVWNCRFPRLKNIAKDFLRFLRFWKHLISSTVKEIQDIFGAFLPKIGTPRWKLYSHSVSKSHNWIDVGALYLRSQESQCEYFFLKLWTFYLAVGALAHRLSLTLTFTEFDLLITILSPIGDRKSGLFQTTVSQLPILWQMKEKVLLTIHQWNETGQRT